MAPRLSLRELTLVLTLPVTACLQQVSTGTGTTTDPTVGPAPTTLSSGGAAPTGSDCSTDPQTQVTLCAGISLCPSVLVDPGVFPNCGFRIQAGPVIDMECLCGTDLCPIGVPSTCDQATQLLSSQSSVVVCEAASDGRCTPVGAPSPEAGVMNTPAGSCDKQCETECAGEPDCIQLCGC